MQSVLLPCPLPRVSVSELGKKFLGIIGDPPNHFHSQPKSQPKSAATTKASATRGGKASTRGAKKAKSARPTKKTAEELDSEMMDYFGGAGTDAPASGAAQPAANGDANMDDEILVSSSPY